MCIIIDLKAGDSIPADYLDNACSINKHGYGISVLVGKKIITFRSLDENDPKKVSDLLQKHKKNRRFIHLRHATVGEVNGKNSHPFKVLDKKETGRDIYMMHNGTLTKYKPKDTASTISDTRLFAETYVQPLLDRCAHYDWNRSPLEDDFFIDAVNDQIGFSASVLMFYDSDGNVVKFNEERGKLYDFGWASNDHMTDRNHTRSKHYKPYSYNGNYHGGHSAYASSMSDYYGSGIGMCDLDEEWVFEDVKEVGGDVPFEVEKEAGPKKPESFSGEAQALLALPPPPPKINVYRKIGAICQNTQRTAQSIMPYGNVNLSSKRKTFLEEANLPNYFSLTRIAEKDLEILCFEHSKEMSHLISDLLIELKKSNPTKFLTNNLRNNPL